MVVGGALIGSVGRCTRTGRSHRMGHRRLMCGRDAGAEHVRPVSALTRPVVFDQLNGRVGSEDGRYAITEDAAKTVADPAASLRRNFDE